MPPIVLPKDAMPPNFVEKFSRIATKPRNPGTFFPLESFPLYRAFFFLRALIGNIFEASAVIRESFLCRNVIFQQAVKVFSAEILFPTVFSLESFPLYSITFTTGEVIRMQTCSNINCDMQRLHKLSLISLN